MGILTSTIGKPGKIERKPKNLYSLQIVGSTGIWSDTSQITLIASYSNTLVQVPPDTNFVVKFSLGTWRLQRTSTSSTTNSLDFRCGFGSNYNNDPSFYVQDTDTTLITQCGADPAPDIMTISGGGVFKGDISGGFRTRFTSGGGNFGTVCLQETSTMLILFQSTSDSLIINDSYPMPRSSKGILKKLT